MQETCVWSLVQEGPTCCGAAKPAHLSYWACAPEPRSCNCRAHVAQLPKPEHPGQRALQQRVALAQFRGLLGTEDPVQPKINKNFNNTTILNEKKRINFFLKESDIYSFPPNNVNAQSKDNGLQPL
mgnify:CR=1 FL=1